MRGDKWLPNVLRICANLRMCRALPVMPPVIRSPEGPCVRRAQAAIRLGLFAV
jgi:hypothetical protein